MVKRCVEHCVVFDEDHPGENKNEKHIKNDAQCARFCMANHGIFLYSATMMNGCKGAYTMFHIASLTSPMRI